MSHSARLVVPECDGRRVTVAAHLPPMICMSHLKLLGAPPVAQTAEPGAADISDGTLVLRALDGEKRAEELLYRRHAPRLLAMCTRLLRSKTLAEDVVQDTFIAGFEGLRGLKQPDSFRSWIGQVAVRLVHRRWRRAKMRQLLGFTSVDAPTLATIADTSAHPEVRIQLADLDRVLRKLDAQDRMAWMLRYVEGQTLSEVAISTRCSLATVKRRVRRADEHVRSHVEVERSDRAE